MDVVIDDGTVVEVKPEVSLDYLLESDGCLTEDRGDGERKGARV